MVDDKAGSSNTVCRLLSRSYIKLVVCKGSLLLDLAGLVARLVAFLLVAAASSAAASSASSVVESTHT